MLQKILLIQKGISCFYEALELIFIKREIY